MILHWLAVAGSVVAWALLVALVAAGAMGLGVVLSSALGGASGSGSRHPTERREPLPDPYAFPPEDTRPRDPGTGEPSDYAIGLPVTPLPPRDAP